MDNLEVSRTPRGVKVVRRHCDVASVALLLLGITCGVCCLFLVVTRDQSPVTLVPSVVAVVAALRNLRTTTAREFLLETEDTNARDTPS